MYCLTVLGARNLRSRCWHGRFFLRDMSEGSVLCIFCSLVVCWQSLAFLGLFLGITKISASIFTWHSPCVCVCSLGPDFRFSWVAWSARRSNQSILKEINPECSLEGLMLKLQYFGHLIWRADSLEKTGKMLGKIEGKRRRAWQRMRWLDGIIHSMTWI